MELLDSITMFLDWMQSWVYHGVLTGVSSSLAALILCGLRR